MGSAEKVSVNKLRVETVDWSGAPPRGRPFLKMHGLRNHFVIVDARSEAFLPTVDDIVRICDVQRGVGGDQLVVLEPAVDGGDVSVRFYNTDGREVEACGNATRCVAWLLMEEHGSDAVGVTTPAGDLACRRVGERQVACDMGRMRTAWEAIPLANAMDTLHVSAAAGPLDDAVAVNIGNPHAVYFVADADAIELGVLGPQIQQLPLFPNQVNVGVAEVVGPTHLKLRVYERGAGLTAACGSGACAAAYAARLRGLTTSDEITVSLPAGDVEVRLTADERAIMTGPVEYCFSGYL